MDPHCRRDWGRCWARSWYGILYGWCPSAGRTCRPRRTCRSSCPTETDLEIGQVHQIWPRNETETDLETGHNTDWCSAKSVIKGQLTGPCKSCMYSRANWCTLAHYLRWLVRCSELLWRHLPDSPRTDRTCGRAVAWSPASANSCKNARQNKTINKSCAARKLYV